MILRRFLRLLEVLRELIGPPQQHLAPGGIGKGRIAHVGHSAKAEFRRRQGVAHRADLAPVIQIPNEAGAAGFRQTVALREVAGRLR